MKRVGLLGCGAIGTEIAIAIDSGKIAAKLTHMFDFSKDSSQRLVSKLKNKPVITENVSLLAASPVDLIIEAASQDAVRDNALSILQNRKDLMIMSVGALLDESIFEIVSEGCKDFNKRVFLPSGAIAGLDSIQGSKRRAGINSTSHDQKPKSAKGGKIF
ncbi:L-Aspartate dehydrogenase [Candidatus Nitrosotalea sp. TS]|nr:L-Aspartate dehydrogenase [Candidatus Nitrosotalea sp. TS]